MGESYRPIIECGSTATWEDEEEKVRFWHALIWHPTISASSAAFISGVSGSWTKHMLGFTYNPLTMSDIKAYKAYKAFNEETQVC